MLRNGIFALLNHIFTVSAVNASTCSEHLQINNHLAPHLREAQIAAVKRRWQIPQPDGCLHTDDKESARGANSKTAEQFSSRQAA